MTDYNQIHFASKPSPARHPSRFETIARLYGLEVKPFDTAKILELGCSTGDNLLPIACLYPDTKCVGIDAAANQIQEGKKNSELLQLKNIHWEAKSFAEADFGPEKFDYIICHGIFSWIDQNVRMQLFQLAAQSLGPQGVFFISFNCNPGWEFRKVLIDFINRRIPENLDASARILKARDLCNFLEEALVDSTEPYGLGLKKEAENAKTQSDSYIYHEILNQQADATSFADFIKIAERFGFSFLADARFERVLSRRLQALHLSTQAQETLAAFASDFEALESLLDYAFPTTLRSSLLVFKQEINRSIDPQRIKDLYLSGAFRLCSPGRDLKKSGMLEFETPAGQILEVDSFPRKAFLLTLGENYPCSLAFDQSVSAINSRFAYNLATDELDDLCRFALGLFSQKLLEILPRHLPLKSEVSDRPHVFTFARLQAKKQSWVTNIRNEYVNLDPFQLELIQLCNGENTISDMTSHILAVATQKLHPSSGMENLEEDEEVRTDIEEACRENIRIFAESSLIVGGSSNYVR
ncbi:MAG: methyltransferase domain-containing protein [Deltaproteobacteria bacterium]|nr:methyltransferase domain-containing protein [Deltaproteobacteria bacterium]